MTVDTEHGGNKSPPGRETVRERERERQGDLLDCEGNMAMLERRSRHVTLQPPTSLRVTLRQRSLDGRNTEPDPSRPDPLQPHTHTRTAGCLWKLVETNSIWGRGRGRVKEARERPC